MTYIHRYVLQNFEFYTLDFLNGINNDIIILYNSDLNISLIILLRRFFLLINDIYFHYIYICEFRV
jgi:hypothetical protein